MAITMCKLFPRWILQWKMKAHRDWTLRSMRASTFRPKKCLEKSHQPEPPLSPT